MIVVDASVLVNVLLRDDDAPRIEERLLGGGDELFAPHLIDLEIAQTFRRLAFAGLLTAERGRLALDDLASFGLTRFGHGDLLSRVWELRDNLTAYDACYVALAELLDAPLLTRDRKLAAAPRHVARVEVV